MKKDFNLTRLDDYEKYIGAKTVGTEDVYE